MMPTAAPDTPTDLLAAYAAYALVQADQPHLQLAGMGFAERDIMRCGSTLLASGWLAAADAEQLIKRFGTLVAGLPLTDTGLVISQLRLAGLQIRDIEIHLTDIIGEAMRQQRLACSGGRA